MIILNILTQYLGFQITFSANAMGLIFIVCSVDNILKRSTLLTNRSKTSLTYMLNFTKFKP
jgi:hypothetical protein